MIKDQESVSENKEISNEIKVEEPLCSGKNCQNIGKLRCPNCKKFGIKEKSFFCGKECFNSSWATHKLLHADYEPINDGFPYTGKLRRYKVTPQRTIPDNIKKPDYANRKDGVSKMEEEEKSTIIPVYNDEDIKNMREICLIGRKVLDIAHKAVKVGVTTDYIDSIVHQACIDFEVYPSPLNYYKFPKSLCTSVNEVICHGIPDLRPLEEGDIVNLDISVYKNGYHSDLNETIIVGQSVDEKTLELVQSAYDCLQLAIKSCKPGVMYKEIGKIISDFIEPKGLSITKTYCGHGIGKLFHCSPNVPHYKNNKAVGVMRPGHIFTIEPMINQGTYKDVTWLDDWTAVTADGLKSAQFEHTILITEDSCEVLTKRLEDSPKLEFLQV